jgi:hypothetical protein
MKDNWIEVNKMQHDLGCYLVCNNDEWVTTAMIQIDKKWYQMQTDKEIFPTHYMPLPEPPKF